MSIILLCIIDAFCIGRVMQVVEKRELSSSGESSCMCSVYNIYIIEVVVERVPLLLLLILRMMMNTNRNEIAYFYNISIIRLARLIQT